MDEIMDKKEWLLKFVGIFQMHDKILQKSDDTVAE